MHGWRRRACASWPKSGSGWLASRLKNVMRSIRPGARLGESPFLYLALEKIFPEDVYAAMLRAMPSVDDYRAMSGRSKSARREDGSPTRVKMDLFPEFIRHLPAAKRQVWAEVGFALRSDALRLAFVER